MKIIRCAISLYALLVAGTVYAGVTQVFLIQNSGWMEPFFEDTKSQLRPLASALIQAASLPSQHIVIASFNQKGAVTVEDSPRVVYEGKAVPAKVSAAIDAITLPKRADGKFADADFQGALNETLLNVVKRDSSLIWLITNNKNDPNNSPDVVKHVQGFYRFLREHPAIENVVAFPITMPVRGRYYREGGLMIYALSFGKSADAVFKEVMRSQKLKALLPGYPILLKPLEKQPLLFEPIEVLTPKVKASISNGSLMLSGLENMKDGGVVTVKGRLTSNYHPQEIEKARLHIEWASFGHDQKPNLHNEIKPASLVNLAPGGSVDNVTISIGVPPLPSIWSSDSLFKNGYNIRGVLRISLTELEMSLSSNFKNKMESIFGLGQLPAIFYPDKNVRKAETLLPVQMSVEYPVWPLALLLISLLLLIVAALIGLPMIGRERRYKVDIDGQSVQVALKPYRKHTIRWEGVEVAEIKGTLFGKPTLKTTNERYLVRLR
jgi:hypothetical protein